MLKKLAFSTLSLLAFGSQPEKPTLKAVLQTYIPIHDIQAIIAGYLNSYDRIGRMQQLFKPYVFTENFIVSLRNLLQGDKIYYSCWNLEQNNISKLQTLDVQTYKTELLDSADDMIAICSSLDPAGSICNIQIFDAAKQKIVHTITQYYAGSGGMLGKFSPNGQLFAVVHKRPVKSLIQIFNTKRFEQEIGYSVGCNVHDIHFSSNSRHLLVVDHLGTITLWDGSKWLISDKINLPSDVNTHVYPRNLAVSDTQIIIIDSRNNVSLWDLHSGTFVSKHSLITHKNSISSFAPTCMYRAEQIKGEPMVIVHDVIKNKKIAELSVIGDCEKLFFSKNGSILIYVTKNKIYIFDVLNRNCLSELPNKLGSEDDLAISSDGQYLAIEKGTTRWKDSIFNGVPCDFQLRNTQLYYNPGVALILATQQKNRRK